jgi:hypothetical protein
MQTLIRQAYDLGRRDALKKAIDVLNSDDACAEPLALMAPDGSMPASHTPEPAEAGSLSAAPSPEKPWWARR